MNEKEVQSLIADYPWLLNLNYETIPNFKNKGMEFQTSDQCRFDLVLRDRITKRPVIVEFKAIPFYRENIGQILEYRSRCLMEMTNEESLLYQTFNTLLSSPVLILVVPECSMEARIACNLSGIEIYEYESALKKFEDPTIKLQLSDVTDFLFHSSLPVSTERHVSVDSVYEELHKILINKGAEEGFKKFRYSSGAYYYSLSNFFINKILFPDNDISIGVFEDIFRSKFNEIAIEYCSMNIKDLEIFRGELKKKKFKKNIPEIEKNDDDFTLTFYEDKSVFIENVSIVEPYIQIYLDFIKLSDS